MPVLKLRVAVQAANGVVVLVTIATRLRAAATAQVASHVPTLRVATSLLQTAASVLLLRAVTSRSPRVVISLSRRVATSPLLRAVKNLTHRVVKSRLAIAAMLRALRNLMQRVAIILTPMRAPSHVRLSRVQSAVCLSAQPTQANPLVLHAILLPVLQHQVAKPSRRVARARPVRAHRAPVPRVRQQARGVASPLTAVAVNS